MLLFILGSDPPLVRLITAGRDPGVPDCPTGVAHSSGTTQKMGCVGGGCLVSVSSFLPPS
uniref:Alternative protein NUDT16L1 n=1 Tax=Homo sapiens TaxID=9606 RepID=L8EAI7_HUMAN|nr:alternative protein NUDT16L1 [Homo sapiens]